MPPSHSLSLRGQCGFNSFVVPILGVYGGVFDFREIKPGEGLFNFIADTAELRFDEGWCTGGMRRVIETDVQPFSHFPGECGTGVAGTSTYGDDIVPLLAEVGIDVGGYVTAKVDTHFFHDLYGQGIDLCGRFRTAGIDFQFGVERLQEAVSHLATATVSSAKNQDSHTIYIE